MTPLYTRQDCSIVDAAGIVIYRDLVQFTDAALDRLVALLNADVADDWADLLQIMEREAAAGQYVLYYRLDEDLDTVERLRSVQAEEDALAAQLASRVRTLLTPQTYAALQAQPYWDTTDAGPYLCLHIVFQGDWYLQQQPDGFWYVIYPGDAESVFLAYSDAGVRHGLLAILAEWRERGAHENR